MQLKDAVGRDISGKVSNAALRAMTDRTVATSDYLAIAVSDNGKTLIAVTDVGIDIAHEKHDGRSYTYDELHSVSLIGSFEQTLFAPLRANEPFDAVPLAGDDAERLAAAAREQLASHHEPGAEWWDSPLGTLGVAVWPSGLLVQPASSPLPERIWYTVSFVNTGVQIRTVRNPKNPSTYPGDHRTFLPWMSIRDVSVEGADQIERRPSVGAVLAFGVLGLGASKAIKRSYFIVSDGDGDYVFERQDMLPLELTGFLAPILRQMQHAAQAVDPMQQMLEEQRETNRLLGEILSAIRPTPDDESEDGN